MMDLVTEEKAARKKEKISNFDLKSIIGIYQWKYKVQESDYFFYLTFLHSEETAKKPKPKTRSASEGTEMESSNLKKRNGRCSETSEVSWIT